MTPFNLFRRNSEAKPAADVVVDVKPVRFACLRHAASSTGHAIANVASDANRGITMYRCMRLARKIQSNDDFALAARKALEEQ